MTYLLLLFQIQGTQPYSETLLMTPSILSSSTASTEQSLHLTFQAFHRAQEEGFRLQDVFKAKLAQRRKLKKTSSTSSGSTSTYSSICSTQSNQSSIPSAIEATTPKRSPLDIAQTEQKPTDTVYILDSESEDCKSRSTSTSKPRPLSLSLSNEPASSSRSCYSENEPKPQKRVKNTPNVFDFGEAGVKEYLSSISGESTRSSQDLEIDTSVDTNSPVCSPIVPKQEEGSKDLETNNKTEVNIKKRRKEKTASPRKSERIKCKRKMGKRKVDEIYETSYPPVPKLPKMARISPKRSSSSSTIPSPKPSTKIKNSKQNQQVSKANTKKSTQFPAKCKIVNEDQFREYVITRSGRQVYKREPSDYLGNLSLKKQLNEIRSKHNITKVKRRRYSIEAE